MELLPLGLLVSMTDLVVVARGQTCLTALVASRGPADLGPSLAVVTVLAHLGLQASWPARLLAGGSPERLLALPTCRHC